MADEESEIRRMAEIADAINAILDADPVGDTPAQGVQGTQAARDDAAAPLDIADGAADGATGWRCPSGRRPWPGLLCRTR